MTDAQRRAVLEMLAQGLDRETIAAQVGVTPGQVSATAAHVTMGTYDLNSCRSASTAPAASEGDSKRGTSTENLLARLRESKEASVPRAESASLFLGVDAETDEEVYWNPDPEGGSANPHLLVLGESGFGKTYTICCLLAELAQEGISSIVFDYGQGFSRDAVPSEFIEYARPTEILASRDGVDINPLQPFPFDLHGPVLVQRDVEFGGCWS